MSAVEERRENKDVLPEGSSAQVVDTAPRVKLKASSERRHQEAGAVQSLPWLASGDIQRH